MANYNVLWKSSAYHDLKKLDRQFLPKILQGIESLSKNPFPPKHKKLTGSDSSYRLRLGEYRLIYHVDTDGKTITIYHLRHRKDAYRR